MDTKFTDQEALMYKAMFESENGNVLYNALNKAYQDANTNEQKEQIIDLVEIHESVTDTMNAISKADKKMTEMIDDTKDIIDVSEAVLELEDINPIDIEAMTSDTAKNVKRDLTSQEMKENIEKASHPIRIIAANLKESIKDISDAKKEVNLARYGYESKMRAAIEATRIGMDGIMSGMKEAVVNIAKNSVESGAIAYNYVADKFLETLDRTKTFIKECHIKLAKIDDKIMDFLTLGIHSKIQKRFCEEVIRANKKNKELYDYHRENKQYGQAICDKLSSLSNSIAMIGIKRRLGNLEGDAAIRANEAYWNEITDEAFAWGKLSPITNYVFDGTKEDGRISYKAVTSEIYRRSPAQWFQETMAQVRENIMQSAVKAGRKVGDIKSDFVNGMKYLQSSIKEHFEREVKMAQSDLYVLKSEIYASRAKSATKMVDAYEKVERRLRNSKDSLVKANNEINMRLAEIKTILNQLMGTPEAITKEDISTEAFKEVLNIFDKCSPSIEIETARENIKDLVNKIEQDVVNINTSDIAKLEDVSKAVTMEMAKNESTIKELDTRLNKIADRLQIWNGKENTNIAKAEKNINIATQLKNGFDKETDLELA